MRPEILRLSAFGAYAGEQVFDLAELGPHRLFLIHGPTGAGKTTLLDAICFALFGESSGEERKAGDLRSHHADERTQTFVEFDFALGTDRYRVRRSPMQMAIGARGKPVKQNPQVTLWKRRADGELLVLAEQDRPVRDQIADLLGYTADEFRQVVLLPQGRFRELLVAPPNARQQILATLFRTAFYRRIEEALAGMERTARDEARNAEIRRATLLQEAAAETPEAAAEAAEALRLDAVAAANQAEAAAAEAAAAVKALEAARQDASRLKAASDAAARLAALEAEQPVVHDKRARVAAAQRAQRLAGEDATAAAAAAAATRAVNDKQAAEEALAVADRRLAAARHALADAEARERQAQATAAEAARLEALGGQAAALAESARAAAEAATALAQAREELQRRMAARDAAVEALTAAAAAHQAAASLAERVEDRRAALDRAKTRAADVAEHTRAVSAAARAEQDVAKARSAAEAARSALNAARAARIEAERVAWANAAARLAATLAEGEACPVCGSHDHPAPAHAVLEGAADVDAARRHEAACDAAERQAATTRVHAEARLQSAIQRRDELSVRVAAAGTATSADAEVATAAAALKAAEDAAAGLGSLAARLAKAQAARQAAEAGLAEQSDRVAKAQEKATSASAAYATRLADVPPEARDPAALAKATAVAKSSASKLQAALQRDRQEEAAAGAALTAAREAAQQAEGRARDAAEAAARDEAQFLAACRAQGFADIAAYRAARLPAAESERLAAELKRYDEALAVARETHRLAAAAVQGLQMPDLPALEAAAKSRTAAAEEARSRAGGIAQRAQAAEERLARIREADLAFATARERHAVVQNLARQASGQNPLRLSFEGFVLASLLDEALAAANDHLQRMLGGRYRVRRREEPLRANAAVGLDIEVLDEWTGQARPAGTLSGGEGFCAALALALGLADTVQAHAGARPVDALLVDEGFGSLDDEALDKAMEVLAGLQSANRIVGIISHVGDLKTRIPARLEVTPGVRGSTARFVVSRG